MQGKNAHRFFISGFHFAKGLLLSTFSQRSRSFVMHFRAHSRPSISRDAKTLKIHKNMQLAIYFAFLVSAFQSFSSSRRSRAARRRIVLGMKIAVH